MSDHQSEQEIIQQQYARPNNLTARSRLHELFSTNPYGWFRWCLDQINLTEGMRLLELGCGTGWLWQNQLMRLPQRVNIRLSDYSQGMLQQARGNLPDNRFQFTRCDAQAIPFAEHTFDGVIANHMLYHVPDRGKAFAEIRRVLKPRGRFFAATNGLDNMSGLKEYSNRLVEGQGGEFVEGQISRWTKEFALENGADQLKPFFNHVELQRYPDGLHITQAKPLVDYLLSMFSNFNRAIAAEEIQRFTQEVEAEIRVKGSIDIPKDGGMFISA
jgi:ubiquinone/menaquinone biosynthesis C-methylase UbiE